MYLGIKKQLSKEELEILNVLESLDEKCFDDLYAETSFVDNIVTPFKNRYNKHNFIWEEGATKGVLIFPSLGFVIKIPFVGDADWYDFYGANNSENCWDYCAAEAELYEAAEEEGLEKAFAKTEFLCEIHGHPIYKQQYVETFFNTSNDSHHSNSHQYACDINEYCDEFDIYCFNQVWVNDSCEYYGKDFVFKLLSFIKEKEIDDLHNANIGYNGKQPLLVDYSSFNN